MSFTKKEIIGVADGLVIGDRIEGNPRYDWIDV